MGNVNTNPLYWVWTNMKKRCHDSSSVSYKYYGARGIKVCDRWLNSFLDFAADVGPRPSKEHQLDRYPDNNGGYRPGNTRWATRSQNSRNRRNTPFFTDSGITKPIAQWAEDLGLGLATIKKRIQDSTITHPLAPLSRGGVDPVRLSLNGETLTLAELEGKYGTCRKVIRARLHSGWPVAAAITTPPRYGNRRPREAPPCHTAQDPTAQQ